MPQMGQLASKVQVETLASVADSTPQGLSQDAVGDGSVFPVDWVLLPAGWTARR